MVPSFTLTTVHRLVAMAALIVGITSWATLSIAQAPAADPASLLNTLLDRAATTAPGTYAVTTTTVSPETGASPLVVQADVMRGAEQTIRAAIVLAGVMSQPYVARVRVLAAAATPGAAPLVAGDAIGAGQAGTIRLIREFTLAPGEYDVHAAVGHARSDGGAIITLNKFRLTVPDVWRGPLAVSPVVLGDAVAEVKRAPGTRPFEFEPTALTPAARDRFAQSGSVHVAFRIYNWTPDQAVKPDIGVEYVFYERAARGQRFFNKLKPQRLHAGTVGPAFDPADGAVTAGMTVPLASFPLGDFDLVVRVTDNRNRQSAERRVAFAVAP